MSIVESETTSKLTIRSMREGDLDAVVRIDAASSSRGRPGYFELMMRRSMERGTLQISLVAESEERVAGFVIGSLYYGEYGMTEPTATIEAIGVEPGSRRQHVAHELFAQLRANVAAIGATSIRTEVDWTRIELLAFLQSEGFVPAARVCLERRVDPTEG